jgi:predicted transcriptional regulator
MNNSKSQQPTLHFRLTNLDWVNCFATLNRAELGVLFYIKTLDPFGDRSIDVNSTVIAEVLDIHRSSVSRALKKLEREGLIFLEVVTAKIRAKTQNLIKPSLCLEAQPACEQTDCASAHNDVRERADDEDLQPVHERTDCASAHNDVRERAADVHPRAAAAHPRTDRRLNSSHSNSSDSSQTYTNFINTLSNNAREKFLNFVSEKVKNFKTPINDLEAWLASKNGAGKERWSVYYAMFQKEAGKAVAPSQDWESHPHREEWIAEIRQGKGRFVALGGPRSELEMRRDFAEWAIANHLVWGKLP